MDRTVELAKEYGTYFYGFDDGIRCWECTHTRLYEIALKENIAIHFKWPDRNCYYEGKIDRFLIANVEPRNFHSIRDFKAGSTLEKQTSEEFSSMSD